MAGDAVVPCDVAAFCVHPAVKSGCSMTDGRVLGSVVLGFYKKQQMGNKTLEVYKKVTNTKYLQH